MAPFHYRYSPDGMDFHTLTTKLMIYNISQYYTSRADGTLLLLHIAHCDPLLHNPIDRVWKVLLNESERCGETKEELYEYLTITMEKYEKTRIEQDLRLHCGVCVKSGTLLKINYMNYFSIFVNLN